MSTTDQTDGTDAQLPDFTELAQDVDPGTVMTEYGEEIAAALGRATSGEIDVTWIQAQSCTGCTMSMLQGEFPGVEEALSEFREAISFHPTLMTAGGSQALEELSESPDILIVEGSIPTEVPRAATLGHDEHGEPRPILDWVVSMAETAEYIVASGSCSAYGGLPAANAGQAPDKGGRGPTGAKGLQFEGMDEGGVFGPDFETESGLPVVNIPGCPAHPDHTLLTLATLLNGHEPELDDEQRPLPFFEPNVHATCSLLDDFSDGNMADHPGDDGCLAEVGCAGFFAFCDDSHRLRNDGTAICRTAGAPCIGCVEPDFWDRFSPFYEKGDDRGATWEGE
ncbi:[NiFe] hydrogenase small subunit HydA [Halapricum sp. CBA1109]|uniref:NADH-quinone oxidoreductase subunit B family protein n=1 Tax=Halapricum sp. CBA1109 TaxID=2668068 RepID=UPI0012FB5814|nr:[NiFe] hydrogenase small subunit HydA [Halapricum sp. CBA1109]MUV90104.1 [NiFe] hydrogenase small subunit HydA [Halapricum sp. CBA1109]